MTNLVKAAFDDKTFTKIKKKRFTFFSEICDLDISV